MSVTDTHRVANTDTSRSLKEVPKEPDAKLRDAKISKCLGLKEKLVNGTKIILYISYQ